MWQKRLFPATAMANRRPSAPGRNAGRAAGLCCCSPEQHRAGPAVGRIANKYKIPLYPISTGKNLTYGGSAPNMNGFFQYQKQDARTRGDPDPD